MMTSVNWKSWTLACVALAIVGTTEWNILWYLCSVKKLKTKTCWLPYIFVISLSYLLKNYDKTIGKSITVQSILEKNGPCPMCWFFSVASSESVKWFYFLNYFSKRDPAVL